jgi:peptidoglycan/LPS O-acetylase OafA/YrhL
MPRHAVLSVDFFFCLSGFVIAFAYDKKFMAGMTGLNFMAYRLIRLYPMIFASVILGGALMIGQNLWAGIPITQSLLLTLASLALIPLGLKYGMQAFPPNDPLWSLFFEMVANAAYGVIGKRISSVLAYTGLLAFAVLLIRAVRKADGIGEIGFANYWLFSFGYIRVAFSFLAGVLLFRLGVHKQISSVVLGSTVVCGLLLMLLNDFATRGNVVYDLVCVLVIIPALVHLGARVEVSGRISDFCTWGGAISYPFYLIHGPVMNLVMSAANKAHFDYPLTLAAVALIVAGVASNLVLNFYDIPLRGWLSKWKRRYARGKTE